MSGQRYSLETKKRAEKLRKQGKTYAEIRKQLSVPKSTLSAWLGEKYSWIFDRKAQLIHLKKIRLISAKYVRQKKIERDELADELAKQKGQKMANDLNISDINVLKSLLAMIYWAEGSKHKSVTGLRFVNTDPRFAFLYINLVRRCFKIDESRFRVHLYLHYYHEKKHATQFWSKLLDIPPAQFWKIYIKKRSKTKRFRRNSAGICFIYYPSNDYRKELLALAYKIHDILSNHPPVV